MGAFTIIYSVLGGLGVFFYGMKTMSDALQNVAGEMIKKIINSLTTNRFLALGVGTLVTMIIQSSSVTTVMVIGFVNAGLMQLTQAIGVIFGANIGTTITGWIISIKVGKYGLLLIGLGIFPSLFSGNPRWRQYGRLMFGLGMIFFGLQIMSGALKPLRSMPEFLDSISYFSGDYYGAYIASALVGCVLTMVIQSSSAMLGITIAMAVSGVIGFNTAAALVIGSNIGTTITALLASVGGNVNAKRAARAHAIFNILGVVIILSIFPWYLDLVEFLIPGEANFINAAGDKPFIAVHIATSHTIFNVVASLCFLPFVHFLAMIVVKITPDRSIKEQHHLVVLGNPTELMPATALVQANTEIEKMIEIIGRMFDLGTTYISGKDDPKALGKLKSYERITDNIQKEVTIFMCKVMEKELSPVQSVEAQNMVRIADELESVADYIEKVCYGKKRFSSDSKFAGEASTELNDLFSRAKKFHELITLGLSNPDDMDISVIQEKMIDLGFIADSVRENHVKRVSRGDYNPLTAMTYSDMVVAVKKIRAHSYNIAEALVRKELV